MRTSGMRCVRFIAILLFGTTMCVLGLAAEQPESSAESAEVVKSIPPVGVAVGDDWQFVLPVDVEVGIGVLSGYGTTDVSGIFVKNAVSLDPGFQLGKRLLLLSLSLEYDSREALGFALDERHWHGGPSVRYRPGRTMDMGVKTDGGVAFRPGWIDLYQPIAGANGEYTGRFRRTDRNSYSHLGGDLYFKYRFSKQFSAEMYGGYEFLNYFDDPGYDGADAPTHLVPGDRHRTRGGLQFAGGTPARTWRYSLDLRIENRQYLKSFARDARTGLTHAAPGGLPANPRLHMVELRVRQRNSLKLVKDVFHLVAVAQYTRNIDVFQGYYTSNTVDGNIDLKWTPVPPLVLSVGYGITYERFTPDGYQAGKSPGDGHPPLDNGDSIRDALLHEGDMRAELSVFGTHLRVFIDGEIKKNQTNFPDYEPGIFPASSIYRIDWDYLNRQLLCGVVFEM